MSSPLRDYIVGLGSHRVHIVDRLMGKTVCGRSFDGMGTSNRLSDAYVARFGVRVCKSCDRMKDAGTMQTRVG